MTPPPDAVELARQINDMNPASLPGAWQDYAWRLSQAVLSEDAEEERAHWARMSAESLRAAEAIRRDDKWPDSSWPSPVERCWYIAAKAEIAELRAALARGPAPSDAERELLHIEQTGELPLSEPVNQLSSLHSHEPAIPPAFDAEGRCLVCGLLVKNERLQHDIELEREGRAYWRSQTANVMEEYDVLSALLVDHWETGLT